MKAHLIDTHLVVPRSRLSAKVKVRYQGHVSQKMGGGGGGAISVSQTHLVFFFFFFYFSGADRYCTTLCFHTRWSFSGIWGSRSNIGFNMTSAFSFIQCALHISVEPCCVKRWLNASAKKDLPSTKKLWPRSACMDCRGGPGPKLFGTGQLSVYQRTSPLMTN